MARFGHFYAGGDFSQKQFPILKYFILEEELPKELQHCFFMKLVYHQILFFFVDDREHYILSNYHVQIRVQLLRLTKNIMLGLT
jgi:hypothetical protein